MQFMTFLSGLVDSLSFLLLNFQFVTLPEDMIEMRKTNKNFIC